MNRKLVPGAVPDGARLRNLEHAITHAEEVFVVTAVTLEDGTGGEVATASAHTHVDYEVPTGSGATWNLSAIPNAGSDEVFVNGIQLRRVGSSPGGGEYTITAGTITLGAALGGSDAIWVHYQLGTTSTHTHRMFGTLTPIAGTTYQLSETPLVGSEQVYVSGLQLRRVGTAPSLGEYSISGSTVTLGWTIDGGQSLWAHYRV